MNDPLFLEPDLFLADWLRRSIESGQLRQAEIDTRLPRTLNLAEIEHAHVHFNAGPGHWPVAIENVGWPSNRPLWTFDYRDTIHNAAGYLWRDVLRAVRGLRPLLLMGTAPYGPAGEAWIDGIRSDLASAGYNFRPMAVSAAAVDADHDQRCIVYVAYRGDQRGTHYPFVLARADRAGFKESFQAVTKSGRPGDFAEGPDGMVRRSVAGVRSRAPGLPLGTDDPFVVAARTPAGARALLALGSVPHVPLIEEVLQAWLDVT